MSFFDKFKRLDRFKEPPNVYRFAKNGDINGLFESLEYLNDPRVRSEAAYWLAEKKKSWYPYNLEILINALNDKDDDVRVSVIRALGKIGDQRVIDSLSDLLKDENPKIKKEVIEALEGLGSSANKLLFLILKDDKNFENRKTAAKILGRRHDDSVNEQLIQTLQDENKDVRGAAASGLGEIYSFREGVAAFPDYSKTVDEDLCRALADHDASVRLAVAQALVKTIQFGHQYSKDYRSIIYPSLDDPNPSIRQAIAFILIKLGQISDPHITKKICDEAARRSPEATNTIRWINEKISREQLMELDDDAVLPFLSLLNSNIEIQPIVVDILFKMGNAEVISKEVLSMSEIFKKGQGTEKIKAIEDLNQILEKIKLFPADETVNLENQKKHQSFVKFSQSWDLIISNLISGLKDNNYWIRYEIIEALGAIKDPRGINPLIISLNDQNNWVKSKAAKALKKLNNDAVEMTGESIKVHLKLFGRQDYSISIPHASSSLLIKMLRPLILAANEWGPKNECPVYKKYPQFRQVIAIGQDLFDKGGEQLMIEAYYEIHNSIPYPGMSRYWWDNVGTWMA